MVLYASISTNFRILVYSFHLFFMTIQIALFLVKSISYGQSQNHFVRDLILIIIAIPGAYIGFVSPVNYSSQPADLTPVLMFFNILTIIRFLKIVQKITFFNSIIRYINEKTLHFKNIILIFSCVGIGLSYFHYLVFNKNISIFQSVNYTMGGILGADFYNSIITLQSRFNIQSHAKLQILLVSVHISNAAFKSTMIAFAIFQLSNFDRENQS